MVKIPVGPNEFRWTSKLGSFPEEEWDGERARHSPTPRVLACGEVLGGYDLGWVVVERLRDRPLSSEWTDKRVVGCFVEAVAEVQARAMEVEPVARPAPESDWERLIERSREAAREGRVEDAQHWNAVLKRVSKRLGPVLEEWRGREACWWCHGDVHPGNACWRRIKGDDEEGTTCVLIDLSRMHGGHWMEDAIQLEYLHWGHEDRLFGVRPVREVRRARRARGLEASDCTRLAEIWRLLAGSSMLASATGGTPPRRLTAGLGHVERVLKTL